MQVDTVTVLTVILRTIINRLLCFRKHLTGRTDSVTSPAEERSLGEKRSARRVRGRVPEIYYNDEKLSNGRLVAGTKNELAIVGSVSRA